MARLDYVERRGMEVVWTDKIAPAMRAAYLWTDDGQSSQAVEEAAFATECSDLLAQTPEITKRRLALEAARLSELDFVLLLRDQFDGLYLKTNPDGSLRAQTTDVRVVKAVYRALKDGV